MASPSLTHSDDEAQAELRDLKLALAAAKRSVEERKVAAEGAERAKADMAIEYRHLTEVTKEQQAELRELQNRNAELEGKLEAVTQRQAAWDKQREAEQAELARQRAHLETAATYAERKLDDDRASLQAQFQAAKHELRRNFAKELEQHRQAWDIATAEMKREHRAQQQAQAQKLGLRVESLERDKQRLHRKLAAAEEQANDDRRKLAQLERDLRREQLNSEVAGTSSIAAAKEASVAPSERKELHTLERKLAHARLKITELGDEVLSLKRQRVAADRQIKALRGEVEEAGLAQHKLQVARDDVERRLSKRVEQLESQLARRRNDEAGEVATARKAAAALVDDKGDEVRHMQQRVEHALAEARDAKSISGKLSAKLTARLDEELSRQSQLERDKSAALADARHAHKELQVLQETHARLTKELARVQHQHEAALKEAAKWQASCQKLEQAVRRLEARV